jgi:hypothetical protein
MLDKIKAKLKDAEYERQHAEFIKRQNLEQVRMLRDEIDKLKKNASEWRMNYTKGKNAWPNAGPISNEDAVEREMRLERLDEKLQETRQKLIETIAEVKTARRASEEASKAVEIDSDDDFVGHPGGKHRRRTADLNTVVKSSGTAAQL